jgi:ABC-type antimicrobial peptide transport system permease subunit
MYLALAKKNLLAQKTRTILTMAGIVIGIGSLIVMMALSEGVKQAVFINVAGNSPLTRLTVQPSQTVGFLRLSALQNTPKITPEIAAKISAFSHVTSAVPQIKYESFAAAQIALLGQTFQTDTMIFGAPFEFLKDDLAGASGVAAAGRPTVGVAPPAAGSAAPAGGTTATAPALASPALVGSTPAGGTAAGAPATVGSTPTGAALAPPSAPAPAVPGAPATESAWTAPAEPYPAVVSRRIIDLYNFTLAPTGNLPQLTEKDLLGTEITILPNYSSLFPNQGQAGKTVRAKIAGFSDKVELVGITLPLEAVKQLNIEHNPSYQPTYSKLFLTIDKAENVEAVGKQITALNLAVSSPQAEIKIIEDNFNIITIFLSLISLIILMVSGLMIANTFYASVSERKYEIGIMRALGATRGDIQKLFLVEAGLLGLISGIIGIIAGIIVSLILNKFALEALPALTQKPDTLFIQNPLILAIALLLAIALSIIFALIPSFRAARLQPLEALG